jgi:hypothetical protein
MFNKFLYNHTNWLGRHLHCGSLCSIWCIRWRLYYKLRLNKLVDFYWYLYKLKRYYWNYRWKPFKNQWEKDCMYYNIEQEMKRKWKNM